MRATNFPVVVMESTNADIHVEIDRFPREGEMIVERGGQTLVGGKGANQATYAGKLSHPLTSLVKFLFHFLRSSILLIYATNQFKLLEHQNGPTVNGF